MFYITEPKLRRIEKSKYIDRIVHRWYVNSFMETKDFENINKNILYNILKRKIKDEKVKWLTKEIIYSNEGEKGLPIGNYTSQLYANIYLNELDQFEGGNYNNSNSASNRNNNNPNNNNNNNSSRLAL